MKLKREIPRKNFIIGSIVLVLVASGLTYLIRINTSNVARAGRAAESFAASLERGDYETYASLSGFNTSEIEFQLDALVLQHLVTLPLKDWQTGVDGTRAVSRTAVHIQNGTPAGQPADLIVFMQKSDKWKIVGIDAEDTTNGRASIEPKKYTAEKFNGWFYYVNIIALSAVPQNATEAAVKDAKRRTDIGLLSAQLRAFYTLQNRYPTLDEMNDPVMPTIPGLAPLHDPDAVSAYASNGFVAAPALHTYSYTALAADGSGCDNQAIPCAHFSLTAVLTDGTQATETD